MTLLGGTDSGSDYADMEIPRMRISAYLTAGLAVIAGAVLTACGGGGAGGGLPDARPSSVTVAVTQVASTVPMGKSFIASATATSQPTQMQKMSWTVAKVTVGAPDLGISNGDCAAATRNNKTINGITQSSWACDAVVSAPASVAADSTYRVTFTGVDMSGNASVDSRDVVVVSTGTGATPLPPSVVTPAGLSVAAGADVGVSCFANSGFLNPGSKYVFGWVVKDNPAGLSLALSPQSDGSLSFKAPLVASAASVTLQCRVTDDNLSMTTSDTVVTISPAAGVVAVANPGSTQTVATNNVVILDGSASTAPGNPVLYYKWIQVSGPSVVMSSADVARPSFMAPLVSDTTRLVFRLVVSTKFPINPEAAAASEQSTVAVFVTPTPPLSLVVTSSQSVKSAVPVVLNVAASPTIGAALYYSWSQVSGPTVTLAGANTEKASFVSPAVAGSPVGLRFSVSVSRKPLAASLPQEIVSSDVVVQVNP
ncbi:PKD domain-containing protein [Paucibacter soli]|uniref:PKD domain-containing protein n=1 Tax=Paucibacter soli TaxID=3133433 RepID=UPI0030AD7470